MSTSKRIYYAGRRVFGAFKRPLFQTAQALTGKRIYATAEYLDFGWFGGRFDAPAHLVQARLPPGFEVIESGPDRATLDIWCADYRRMDVLQPYREVAVLTPVRFANNQSVIEGEFVLHMYVTSEEARWTGVDLHGFPKTVGNVDIGYSEEAVTCAADQRRVPTLSLRVETRHTQPFKDTAVLLNVRSDGMVVRSDFEQDGQLFMGEVPGGVVLTLGEDAIADQLRDMQVNVDSGRALYMPHAHAVLHKPMELGQLDLAPSVIRHRAPAPPPAEAAVGLH